MRMDGDIMPSSKVCEFHGSAGRSRWSGFLTLPISHIGSYMCPNDEVLSLSRPGWGIPYKMLM